MKVLIVADTAPLTNPGDELQPALIKYSSISLTVAPPASPAVVNGRVLNRYSQTILKLLGWSSKIVSYTINSFGTHLRTVVIVGCPSFCRDSFS